MIKRLANFIILATPWRLLTAILIITFLTIGLSSCVKEIPLVLDEKYVGNVVKVDINYNWTEIMVEKGRIFTFEGRVGDVYPMEPVFAVVRTDGKFIKLGGRLFKLDGGNYDNNSTGDSFKFTKNPTYTFEGTRDASKPTTVN